MSLPHTHSEKLCHYMKKCYMNGWISSRDGNMSILDVDNDIYYITPTSVPKSCMTVDDIVMVDMNTGQYSCNNNRKPSGEIHFHSKFMERRDSPCVFHCHPPYTLAYVGLLNRNVELDSLKDIFPEISVNIGPNVEYMTARTPELAQHVYNNLVGHDIVALKRHGIVCVAESPDRAFEIVDIVEYHAKIAVLELSITH